MSGYVKQGELIGIEIGTVVIDGIYFIRLEANAASAQLVQELGAMSTATYIAPELDSGRPWFQLPYTPEIDQAIVDLVDMLIDIRRNQPSYGQMRFEK